MSGKKLDGIIEAVHYSPDGKISLVRVYERRGAVWSDRFLLERKDLIDRLKNKKRYVVGERKVYLGSVFETGPAVRYRDNSIMTEGQPTSRDLLAGVGIF
jgi:hypothetical protein